MRCIDKDTLKALYIDNHLTMQQIGNKYGVTRACVSRLVKNYGIDASFAESFFINCAVCGVEFRIYRKRYNKARVKYCSVACYHKHRQHNYQGNRQGQRTGRAAMERHLNRKLKKGEAVHHIDGNCLNNNIDNLLLFPSNSEHIKHHHSKR